MIRFLDLPWRSLPLPFSSPPVRVANLHGWESAEAFVVMAEFPADWSRPTSVFAETYEEFFVVEGEISLTGTRFESGDYAMVPARSLRSDSHSPDGALTIAWFSGVPRWKQASSSGGAADKMVRVRNKEAPVREGPMGLDACRFLGESHGHSTWLVEEPLPQPLQSHFDVELLALTDLSWTLVPAGRDVPPLEGPLFCRLYSGSGM